MLELDSESQRCEARRAEARLLLILFSVKVRADFGVLQCGQSWTVGGEVEARGRKPTPFTDDLLWCGRCTHLS